ncbi:tRNA1(Val) (adenine(37)-N6)-methyltransferase [Gallaecimonas mangrovi]|uniref:tRNA1(Val) (adenine(37)-N6)-methyltransferase n=1 Tax=Gallaecimonas mangrovi TaxID=2291597 RepID=UPI00186964FA|nr:methyltransferase [Gallaecimonas mangrovi]
MSKGFQFKQFFVGHDHCAMKVGTDGVLLGLWATLPNTGKVLDIGAGTGLVSLMLAQRGPSLTFDAVELDAPAATQAKDNVAASPFAGQIVVHQQDIANFDAAPYSLVVANPPFFVPDVRSPKARRDQARHVASLPPSQLAQHCARLGAKEVAMVLPWQYQHYWAEPMASLGYQLQRSCAVTSVAGKAEPVRVLLQWGRNSGAELHTSLTLRDQHGQWTPAFRALGKDFYLNF